MKKIAKARFISPALFGFETHGNSVKPYLRRVVNPNKDPIGFENQMVALDLKKDNGELKTINLCAGYVRIEDFRNVPAIIDRLLDEKGYGTFQIQSDLKIKQFKPDGTVWIYEIRLSTGGTIFVLKLN